MKKLSKKQKKLKTLITQDNYTIDDGLSLLQKIATAKFVESAEVHIALNIDPKYGDQQLRTTLVLPKGNGKTKKIEIKLTVITINKLEFVKEISKFPISIFGPIVLTSNCCIGFAIKLVFINHFRRSHNIKYACN